MKSFKVGMEAPTSSPRDILAGAIQRRHAILFAGVIDGMHDGYQMLAEFYRREQGVIGPLRSWLDRNWKLASERVAGSPLHKLIVELGFPAIYTTNYDRNLETAFQFIKSRMQKSPAPRTLRPPRTA
jgi:hypothetical protein